MTDVERLTQAANARWPRAIKTPEMASDRIAYLRGLPMTAVEDAMLEWARQNPDEKAPNWRAIKDAAWRDVRSRAAYASGQGELKKESFLTALFRRWGEQGCACADRAKCHCNAAPCLWAAELVRAGVDDGALADWQRAAGLMASYVQRFRSNEWGTHQADNDARTSIASGGLVEIASLVTPGEHTASIARMWRSRLEFDLAGAGVHQPARIAAAAAVPESPTIDDRRMF